MTREAFKYIQEELRRSRDPREEIFAGVVASIHQSLGRDILLPFQPAEGQILRSPEYPPEFRSFTEKEIKILKEDGAEIIVLTGTTIEDQRRSGGFDSIELDKHKGEEFLKLPSLRTEVAIYPDPQKCFIPETSGKNLVTQEALTKIDAQQLRKRTGLGKDIDEIIPDQASTLTELIIKYLDRTTKEGKPVWLFGKDYGYPWCQTKNPVGKSGSDVAFVNINHGDHSGHDDRIRGIWFFSGSKDGRFKSNEVVRLVVARKNFNLHLF